ncbi:hypothetical protein B0T18DRAFT_418515 [Schizothecium vesticola]|uniref:Uncharacterized protein n=1 Tax=Schizothecium vesticola TaxID=314040 RepID=A0AA40EJZ0_9PEZI|nr:hypothetical protein B0T18DRAFT_418515 [Schizothecium vesticola]
MSQHGKRLWPEAARQDWTPGVRLWSRWIVPEASEWCILCPALRPPTARCSSLPPGVGCGARGRAQHWLHTINPHLILLQAVHLA